MTAHRHAEKMRLYAEDAAETDTPWERWQYFGFSEEWLDLFTHPAWLIETEYRRKPKPLETWANICLDGNRYHYASKDQAERCARDGIYARIAVHMREVTE